MTEVDANANVPGTAASSVDAPRPPRYDLSYRDQFWASRAYEDGCDRLALRGLLPKTGGHLVDLGAGFGRLIDEYDAFDHVTLVDASPVMVEAARERVAGDPRFTVVEGNGSSIPIADGVVDVVVAIRLMVHLGHPESVLTEVARIVRPGGVLILEFANRDHLLARIRNRLRPEPRAAGSSGALEYKEAHFSHRRRDVEHQLRAAGFVPISRRAVSVFRSRLIKRLVDQRILLWLEARLQVRLALLDLTPSVHIAARRDPGAGS